MNRPWERVEFGRGPWRASLRLTARQMWWAPSSLLEAIGDALRAILVGLLTLVPGVLIWFCAIVAQLIAGLLGFLREAPEPPKDAESKSALA